MPYQRLAEAILVDWQAAVRDLATVAAEAAEADRLRAEIERLRVEYHRLDEEAVRNHVPGLPSFPATAEDGPTTDVVERLAVITERRTYRIVLRPSAVAGYAATASAFPGMETRGVGKLETLSKIRDAIASLLEIDPDAFDLDVDLLAVS